MSNSKKVITGNYAAAYAAKAAGVQFVAAYPITPQTTIIEKISEFCAKGEMDAAFVNAESEHSVMSLCYGAAAAGIRTFTATSGQGLAYMHEMIHWVGGARLPIVMVVVNRGLGAPWNGAADQEDSLANRDAGWLQFYCESAEEVYDTILQAYKVSEKVLLPAMVCCDGFYLSHNYEIVDLLDDNLVYSYLGPYEPVLPLSVNRPVSYHGGVAANLYSQILFKRQSDMDAALTSIIEANEEFMQIFGRSYQPVETYQIENAETVIVTNGTITTTVRSVLDEINSNSNSGVGLLKIRLFRPFPKDLLRKLLCQEKIKQVLVIDRNISGVFYNELKSALYGNTHQPIISCLIAAGQVDITPEIILKALSRLQSNKFQEESFWAGQLV